jgi:hypothetical protein
VSRLRRLVQEALRRKGRPISAPPPPFPFPVSTGRFNSRFSARFSRYLTAAADPYPAVTTLLAAAGGPTHAMLWDCRQGVTLVSGEASQWLDTSGTIAFSNPSAGARPTVASAGAPLVSTGGRWMTTPLSSRFRLDGAFTLVYIGTMVNGPSNSDYYLAATNSAASTPNRIHGIVFDVAFATVVALTWGNENGGGHRYVSGGVAPSSNIRVAIASKGSAGGTSALQIPNQAANAGGVLGASGSGGVITSTTDNALALFAFGAAGSVQTLALGAGACNAVLALDHVPTSDEIAAIVAYATSEFSAVLA